MSEKPEKRLVGWKEYMQTRCKKVLLNTSAVVSGCLGIYILLGVAINVIPMRTYSEYWITVITCGVGIVAVWLTTILIRKSKTIEPVQPITRRTPPGSGDAQQRDASGGTVEGHHEQAGGVTARTSDGYLSGGGPVVALRSAHLLHR
jgi:hypothetical protein